MLNGGVAIWFGVRTQATDPLCSCKMQERISTAISWGTARSQLSSLSVGQSVLSGPPSCHSQPLPVPPHPSCWTWVSPSSSWANRYSLRCTPTGQAKAGHSLLPHSLSNMIQKVLAGSITQVEGETQLMPVPCSPAVQGKRQDTAPWRFRRKSLRIPTHAFSTGASQAVAPASEVAPRESWDPGYFSALGWRPQSSHDIWRGCQAKGRGGLGQA